jgi:hypothetical protein
MRVFFGILVVCAITVVTVKSVAWFRKARAVETEVALAEEANYRNLNPVQWPGTPNNTTQVVELLTKCLDPKSHMAFSSPGLNSKVEAARGLAVSNLVKWLETNSRRTYGTNVKAWEDWLREEVGPKH